VLEITNLHATVADKPILNGVTLDVPAGEVHAIMGPNGSGKSTLAYVLAGRPGYEVSEGSVTFTPTRHPGLEPGPAFLEDGSKEKRIPGQARDDDGGLDLLAMEPHERAAAGLFLGFQYPVEIPGVSYLQFLRESLNSQRRARGETELSGAEFIKLARSQAAALGMDAEMLKRPVNVGFSGGEKKRAEMVQMGIMQPKFAVLDETDSGLDIDALKAVGAGINRIMRGPDKGVLLITHYQRLLDYVEPDKVHVLNGGKIVRSGGPELAKELEREGYAEAAA
jgi:Fe-S cluster assembly ATP-binding protein